MLCPPRPEGPRRRHGLVQTVLPPALAVSVGKTACQNEIRLRDAPSDQRPSCRGLEELQEPLPEGLVLPGPPTRIPGHALPERPSKNPLAVPRAVLSVPCLNCLFGLLRQRRPHCPADDLRRGDGRQPSILGPGGGGGSKASPPPVDGVEVPHPPQTASGAGCVACGGLNSSREREDAGKYLSQASRKSGARGSCS